jgi:hypothetical protein
MSAPDSEPDKALPAELRAFLFSCIDVVEQAEVLLLLAASPRPWTMRETAAELALPEPATRGYLEVLTARGLLRAHSASEVSYRYEPRSSQLAGYVEMLRREYESNRSTVLRQIMMRSTKSARNFANAFKLRDPEKP